MYMLTIGLTCLAFCLCVWLVFLPVLLNHLQGTGGCGGSTSGHTLVEWRNAVCLDVFHNQKKKGMRRVRAAESTVLKTKGKRFESQQLKRCAWSSSSVPAAIVRQSASVLRGSRRMTREPTGLCNGSLPPRRERMKESRAGDWRGKTLGGRPGRWRYGDKTGMERWREGTRKKDGDETMSRWWKLSATPAGIFPTSVSFIFTFTFSMKFEQEGLWIRV